jgi:hypothetical protein
MPKSTVPLRSPEDVASNISHNIRTILAEQGHDLDWLAAEIGIDVHTILRQFSEKVEFWLVVEAASFLGVSPDRLLEAGA